MSEEYEVEKILKKEIRNGKEFYFLKWKDYSNWHNTWEPLENMNCVELVADFEGKRICKIFGVAKRNGQLIYVIGFNDKVEPDCIPNNEARIYWSKFLFDFLLQNIQYVDFQETYEREVNFLMSVPDSAATKIIYATDSIGFLQHFAIEFPEGIFFATAASVKENWIGLALDFMEEHLIIH